MSETTLVIPALVQITGNRAIIADQLEGYKYGNTRLCQPYGTQTNNNGQQYTVQNNGSELDCDGTRCKAKNQDGNWAAAPSNNGIGKQVRYHLAKEFFDQLGQGLDDNNWEITGS